MGRHAHIFAGKAVEMFTRYIPSGGGGDVARQPVGIERADDVVSDCEFAHFVANRNYLSGTVGERNAAVGKRHFAPDDKVVAQIQGACLYSYQHLTGSWFWTIFLDDFEVFQATRGSQSNQSHRGPP